MSRVLAQAPTEAPHWRQPHWHGHDRAHRNNQPATQDFLYDNDNDEDEDGDGEDEPLTLQQTRHAHNSHIHAHNGRTHTVNHTALAPPAAAHPSLSSAQLANNSATNDHGNGIPYETYQTAPTFLHDSGELASLSSIKELDPADSPSDNEDRHTRPLFSTRNLRLILYVTLAVIVTSANSITWKRTLNRFRATDGSSANMEFFVTQLTIFLYVALAATILAYRWFFTELITDEQKRYSQKKFGLMGLMDSIAGLCSSLGGAFSSGQVQTVINQLNIPMTMILSRSLLSTQFSRQQIGGALLILIGSFVSCLGSSSGGESSTLWFGPMILVLSTLPNSASNVYKETNFKEDNLDVFFLTTSVSFYQVLVGFLFCPLLALPALGGVSLTGIPDNFHQGWKCYTGEYVEGFDCHVSPHPWVVLWIYVFVNFGLNILLLLITKHGSALLLVIASALSLPFTNLVFTMPFIMGHEAEQWSWVNAIGLAIVIVGFLFYSILLDQSGEFMPAQQAAGQMMFIVETVGPPVTKRRRHSFDATNSPLIIASSAQRKREAQQRYKESRGFLLDAEDDDRMFFTPP